MRRLLLAAGLVALPLTALPASHGLTPADLVSLARVSDPALSPDGTKLVYTLRETDLAADRGRTDLWLMALDGDTSPARLTSDQENDGPAEWAADGSGVFFLSSRAGTPQVWYIAVGGGEATQVTRLPLEVTSFRVSPRGDRLAISLEVFPDCRDLDCTRKRLDERKSSRQHGQAYDRLFVRHWDKWKDGRVSRLYSVVLDAGRRAGAAVALTAAVDGDVPSKPLGGRADYAFSPDGREIAFAARLRGRSEPWSTNFDIWRVTSDGSGTPVNVTQQNSAWDAQPAYSPDGRLIAHLAMQRPGFEADRFRLIVRDLATGAVRFTTEDWDRSVGAFRFAADGKSVYVAADDIGQRPLWSVDLATGERGKLTDSGNVAEFETAGRRVVYALQGVSAPADFHLIDGGAQSRRLTAVNADRLAEVRFGDARQFSFAGANDEKVYGYVVKPWNWQPGRRYPVAFIIHGGPQSSFANTWSYRWNPQVYAGAGYGVVFIDFHGSTGYGQAFTDSISGDWGGKPLADLQKGLAAALDGNEWLDGEWVCALGASYGGYMINWIAGNWPDRFRCLVSHAGLFDHRTMYYTTEELWFVEWDHGGPYFENPGAHEKSNPANQVKNWKAPMLVIHGALDYRVPYSQGLAAFTALQRRGIESRFLFFPDENHWISKPGNSLQWHDEVLGWLAQHLK